MGYLKIPNLYSNTTILLFKECFAAEKIHGSSTHVSFKNNQLTYFAGGANHENFVKLFNHNLLLEKFKEIGATEITIFGEGYGGKLQGMSETYGKELKFIAFDVQIGECWLDLPKAEQIVKQLGLEFVYYQKISTDLVEIDKARDMFSPQAKRNGCGDKIQEGIVLRPPIELAQNNGSRIICKHKRKEFMETKTERIVNEEDFRHEMEQNALVDEWVTVNRLKNALSHFPHEEIKIENIFNIIKYMIEDVFKECEGEVPDSKEMRKLISRKTALLFKEYLNNQIYKS